MAPWSSVAPVRGRIRPRLTEDPHVSVLPGAVIGGTYQRFSS